MMPARSVEDPEFRRAVVNALARNGEVLALFRFHAAAGSRSLELFVSLDDLDSRVSELPPKTSVIVFVKPQIPLRGTVDEQFVSTALRSLADGTGWLLVCLEKTFAGGQSWFHDCPGRSQEELEQELREQCWGQAVAIGREPDWSTDSDTVFSAVTPDDDGIARPGTY